MPDATDILAQWEAVCEAATEAPWDEDGDGVTAGDDAVACCIERSADMRFIAAARTGWPAAIRALKELMAFAEHEDLPWGDPNNPAAQALEKAKAILEGRDALHGVTKGITEHGK